jgi:general secretion pathway protein D
MQSKKRIYNLLLSSICVLIIAGCAGKAPLSPPYFKDIYESSRQKDGAETEGQSFEEKAGDTAVIASGKPIQSELKKPAFTLISSQLISSQKSVDSDLVKGELKQLAAKKPVVRIISMPNPLKRETVKAESGSDFKTMVQGAPEELQKPLELSAQAASGEVQVVVENMPLYDFANLALGEMLKINYVISPEVQNAQEKVTLNMGRKMSGKDFFPLAIDLLRRNNLDIRDENGMIHINRKNQQTTQNIGGTTAEIFVGSIPAGLSPQKTVTLIISTSYVPINQILMVVRQLQLMNSDIKSEYLSSSQSLALFGTIGTLNRVSALFEQFDRTTFANRDFNLIYFDYINVLDFDKKLKELLPAIGVPIARTVTDVGLLTMPFEKINALLVISARKEWLEATLSWKEKLDAVESMGDDMQMFVYRPKNRPAEELVEVLKAVASGGAVPTVAGAQKSSVVAQPAVIAAGTATPPGKGFSAILDKGRNAVIVSSSPANYKLIRNILKQLDTQPKQVLIEASIMEVTLTGNLQYGVEWLIKNRIHKGGDTYNGVLGTLGGLALGSSGLNYSVIGGDITAKLNAFAKDSQINIVSTPHIATLDGKEASISVGTEVPIVTSESSAADLGTSSGSSTATTTPSIMRSIQYRNTGVILHVKPTINSDGALTIDIGQELSEAQNNSVSNIDSPIILNRSIKTTLSVRSGDTVLLGGLISTNKSKGEQRVPLLGSIPFLGWLFKTESKGETKTELIVQITPYILDNAEQLDDITKKFKDSVFLK